MIACQRCGAPGGAFPREHGMPHIIGGCDGVFAEGGQVDMPEERRRLLYSAAMERMNARDAELRRGGKP